MPGTGATAGSQWRDPMHYAHLTTGDYFIIALGVVALGVVFAMMIRSSKGD